MKGVIALIAIAAVAVAASDVVVLTKDTFTSTIEAGPTLVEFYAPWCGHCKHLEPIYDKLATEVKGRGVTIAKVDCVDQKTLQAEYGIRGFPTIKLFKNGGKEVVDYRSARDVASFSAFLTEHATLAPPAKPHLRYFEARGRAELIRLILEEVGVAYEDTRLTHESWANEKPNTDRYTFGQMPQITVDGIELVQSGAIARYFARKHGLYGTDGTSATLVDVVYGGFEDLRAKYSTLVYDKDFESKRAEFSTKTLAVWLPHFERILERNAAGNNQFFVGSKLTFADAEAFDVLEPIYALDSKAFDAHPRLLAFLKAFATRPNIAAYLSSERRPAFAHGNVAYFYNAANPPTTVFKA